MFRSFEQQDVRMKREGNIFTLSVFQFCKTVITILNPDQVGQWSGVKLTLTQLRYNFNLNQFVGMLLIGR